MNNQQIARALESVEAEYFEIREAFEEDMNTFGGSFTRDAKALIRRYRARDSLLERLLVIDQLNGLLPDTHRTDQAHEKVRKLFRSLANMHQAINRWSMEQNFRW